MDRSAYLTSLIGRPWRADGEGPDAYSCYGLFRALQRELWDRDLPHVDVPPDASRRWMIEAMAAHDLRRAWQEIAMPPGLITAPDGAGVLMARADRAVHVGVLLGIERGIIHADDRLGVVFETPAQLKARGWGRLRFYLPADQD